MRILTTLLTVAALAVVAGCGEDSSSTAAGGSAGATGATGAEAARTNGDSEAGGPEAKFPAIEDVKVTKAGENTFDFAVTLRSEYDSPERYADGWRVLGPDDQNLGTHMLGHDHASEQPFTRDQSGVQIPADVKKVAIEPRDQDNGFSGEKTEVALPGR